MFWELKEHLVHGFLQDGYSTEFLKLLAVQKIGLQGFPPTSVNAELVEQLRSDAINGVKEVGRHLMPWLPWPTPEQVKHSEETQLASQAQPLINAWIRNFDPDNAEAYQDKGGDS